MSFCKKLIEEIAPYQPIIVTGFAQGVDICAHLTALKMGLETVAVLGHGFTKWYPKSNAQFVSKILDNGAFLSEFWHSSHFDSKNFIRRNRIVAGLAHATVVIESEKKGGSLVTANIALAYGREFFAVPGRVTDKKSEGCLNLIKYDRARIITSGEDLVKWLEWEEKPMGNPQIQKQLFQSFSKKEQVLYSILETPHSLDDLSFKSKLSISQVASLLLQLEIKSAVRPLAGKKFERF